MSTESTVSPSNQTNHHGSDPVRDLVGYRVLAVHAHPDDESISTGGALAHLARRGADVRVVTCTLGEEGEVIGEPYQHLVANEADQLGGFRIHELTDALGHLGVRGDFLGGAGRYRDSGMAGSPASENPRAFVNNTDRAVADLTAVLLSERPHLVITYDPNGGYGHPDHIQAHRITHAAVEQAGPLGWNVPRVLWAARLRSELEAAFTEDIPESWTLPAQGELDAVDAAGVDTWVELDDVIYAAKVAAMKAHATQVWIADGSVSRTNPHAAHARGPVTTYALSNLIAQPIIRREHYKVGVGLPLTPGDDLMAGVSLHP